MHDAPDIEVGAVVALPPDHDGWWEGSLHELATELGYPVIDEGDILEYDIDYIISTLYYKIIGSEVLNHPTHGALNLHQAELPRYRGSHSFSHAILNARSDNYWQYGTTIHFMSEDLDAGDIVDRRFVEITRTDTAKSLYERVEDLSVELFQDLLPAIASTEVDDMGTPQSKYDSPKYHYTRDDLEEKKAIPAELFFDPERSEELFDRIRAVEFPPFEPAFIEIEGRKIYLTTKEYGGAMKK